MPLGVGIIGVGTVGGGVVQTLQANGSLIADRTGRAVALRHVATRTRSKLDAFDLNGVTVSDDPMAVIADPEVEVVCELIGGEEPAKTYVLAALNAGKHVVTANKLLLAKHGPELNEAALANGVDLRYEAAVAGGVPVIKALREGLAANRVEYVYAILNGTCNYILSRMTYDGLDFAPVLEQAIEKGFAEQPPDLDIDGHDTAHKCQIVASLAFGTEVAIEDLYVEGIRHITRDDVADALEMGYYIKLLAIVRDVGDSIEARVHPTLVPQDHLLAQVRNEFNGVFIQTDICDGTLLYGRGAGRFPTASAVVADIVDIARRGDGKPAPPFVYGVKRPVRDIAHTRSRFYLRFTTEDRPGILAKITAALGNEGVSIASVIQKEQRTPDGVHIVIMTAETEEAALRRALDGVEASGVNRAQPHVIRVL